MRKRNKEENSWIDNAEHCQGSKRRRKTKSSEKFARELQSFENTLDNVKRLYADSKDRIARDSVIKNLCYTESCDKVSTPPILSGIIYPQQDTLALSMPQTPFGLSSPASSKHISTLDSRESIQNIDGIQEVTVSACVVGSHEAPLLCFVDGNHEAPSLCIEPPSETYGDIEAIKGRESLNHNMQQEPLCRLPCTEAAVADVSNVFSFFLKRLIKFGVDIDISQSPGYVKDLLVSHQVKDTKLNGVEDLKEAEPKKQSETISLFISKNQEDSEDLKEVELEKHFKSSSLLLSKSQDVAKDSTEVESEMQLMRSSVVFNANEEVTKESKEVDPEKNNSLFFTLHEDNAEELKETETKKQIESSSLFFSSREQVTSDSDNEDDGDLKHLWDDMEFSLALMNESKRSQAGPAGNNKNDACNHNFYKKDDVGLVCSLCGLVGQDTEHIFNYIWGEASKKRHNGKHVVAENPNTVPTEEELSDGLTLLPLQLTNQALVLHSEYRDKIRAHQEEGIRFLQRNLVQDEPNGCILAHAPGTGKSFLIIAFLQSFQSSFPDERPLIIAPNGMLSVWVREFQKWKVEDIPIFNLYEAPSLQEQDDNDNRALSQRRHGQLEMLQQWKAQKSVLLVGYPTFSRLISGNDASFFPGIKKLLLEVPGLLILDEGHFPRNKDTQILKSLSQVQTRRRVLLSGTLFQNNFYELYNLYYLVRPDFMTLNASCTKSLLEDFMKANPSPAKMKLPSPKCSKQRSRREDMELRLFENLGETIKMGEPEKKRQAISQLRQLSEPFVHWYKGQVLEELPGLIDLTLFLKMTCVQEELLASLQAKVENQLDRAIKSNKICIHPSLVNMVTDASHNSELSWKDYEIDPKSSSKIMFVLDLLQLATPRQEKVLLFSQLLDPFHLLEKLLKKLWGWHFNKEILKIEGQTSLEERESVIDRFNQDPKTRILFASIKTCGEGVSLIGASRIVLLDVHWNPMVSRQAISRAFRIGQKRKVFVYRLVARGAVEEYAHMKASEKEWLAKQIFEGSRDEEYASYCHEVNPQEVDTYFESQYLRENVLKCFRYHFV